ncbi:MAG: L-lactate dehydrogenase, partial [Eubacterium aggregans]
SIVHHKYGIDDIVLSLPAIVGSEGVEAIVPKPLSPEEIQKLQASANTLKAVAEEVFTDA